MRKDRIKLNCKFCGKEFEVNRYRFNNCNPKYCSYSCLGKERPTEKTKFKMSEVHKKIILPQRFKKGGIPWNKNLHIQTNTGKTHFKKGQICWNYIDGRSKFKCPDRYGDDWDKIRYLVYIRDNFTCQDCGINKKSLDIHHIIPFLQTYDNSLNNLITLCRSCHAKREREINREVRLCHQTQR